MRLPRVAFGVPLHPLLVHFPIAFWLAVPVLDLAALYAGPAPWWTGAGGNHHRHLDRRAGHCDRASGVPRAVGRRHRYKTGGAAWDKDHHGLDYLHIEDVGGGSFTAHYMVNDPLPCAGFDRMCTACARRFFRHQAGLPATRRIGGPFQTETRRSSSDSSKLTDGPRVRIRV